MKNWRKLRNASLFSTDFDSFYPASSEVAERLSVRPRGFFSASDYFKHVSAIIQKAKWWQAILSIAALFLLGFLEDNFWQARTPYVMDFFIGPIIEETAKTISIRTRLGRLVLGGGFAIEFPLLESVILFEIGLISAVGKMIFVLALERVSAVFLHLFTHFILAYKLSVFGADRRALGSLITAIGLHGTYNAIILIINLLVI